VQNSRAPISHRLLLLFAAVIVAAGIVLLLFEWRESALSGSRRLSASNAQRTTLAMLVSVLNLRAAELGLAITGEPRYRQSVEALLPQISAELNGLHDDNGDIRELRELLRAKLLDTRRLLSAGDAQVAGLAGEQRISRIRMLCESISERYLEIRNAEASRQQNILLWNHMVLVLVSLIVLALLLTATFRIEKLLQNLAVERDRYQLLAGHIDQVREEERATLARELHDDIGQVLTSLKLSISSVSAQLDAEGRRTIGSVNNRIDEAIQKTRNVCSMLRPPVLDQLGLLAAIEWLTREFRESTGIACSFRSSAEEPVYLDQERRLGLFRITQEALTNAARHARPSSILVTAYRQEGALVLEVQDTGVGFHPAKIEVSKTLGLAGMQERARLIGAELDIESEPGQGTSVRVKIPCKEGVAA
jgi:signal transduction histidine kinase